MSLSYMVLYLERLSYAKAQSSEEKSDFYRVFSSVSGLPATGSTLATWQSRSSLQYSSGDLIAASGVDSQKAKLLVPSAMVYTAIPDTAVASSSNRLWFFWPVGLSSVEHQISGVGTLLLFSIVSFLRGMWHWLKTRRSARKSKRQTPTFFQKLCFCCKGEGNTCKERCTRFQQENLRERKAFGDVDDERLQTLFFSRGEYKIDRKRR